MKLIKHINMYKYKKIHQRLITDHFFTKGHAKIKVNNILIAILFWLIACLPFLLVGYAIIKRHDVRLIHFLSILIKFFGIWWIIFLVTLPLMSLYTNYIIKHDYHKKKTYDPKRLVKRKTWLHQYYAHKFGQGLHRHTIYYIDKDNNIPVNYIMRTYRKKAKQYHE